MREAIQYPPALRESGYSGSIVLLIEEKAGFLTVYIIHIVMNAILNNFDMPIQICSQSGQCKEPLSLLHSLFFPELNVVTLIYRVDLLSGIFQD